MELSMEIPFVKKDVNPFLTQLCEEEQLDFVVDVNINLKKTFQK